VKFILFRRGELVVLKTIWYIGIPIWLALLTWNVDITIERQATIYNTVYTAHLEWRDDPKTPDSITGHYEWEFPERDIFYADHRRDMRPSL
jgi:hypothetical protein